MNRSVDKIRQLISRINGYLRTPDSEVFLQGGIAIPLELVGEIDEALGQPTASSAFDALRLFGSAFSGRAAVRAYSRAQLRDILQRLQGLLASGNQTSVQGGSTLEANRTRKETQGDTTALASPASGQLTTEHHGIASGPPVPDDRLEDSTSRLSVTELSERFGIRANRLRKRLDRWRRTHDDGFIEVADRSGRLPRYLYQVSAVREVIEDLRRSPGATSRTASKRPATGDRPT
jgi:hypothetical protein